MGIWLPRPSFQLEFDLNLLDDLRYIGYVCYGIIVVTCLGCILWTLYYKNSMIVKASQPFFLIMTSTGVLIMSSAIIPLSYDDNGNASNFINDATEYLDEGSNESTGPVILSDFYKLKKPSKIDFRRLSFPH